MPFPQSSPYASGVSSSTNTLNLSPSVGSDGPRHYTTGYLSTSSSSNQNHLPSHHHDQTFNSINPNSQSDQDDWIPSSAQSTRIRTGPGSASKSSFRGSTGGGLFSPKENLPIRNSRSHQLFGSTTKLAHSVKSKRLSEALEDDAPPKESLFDEDLSHTRSTHDPTAHRTMASSLSSHQQPDPRSSSPAPDQPSSTGFRVHVFGFVHSQQAFVLKHFSSIGELLKPPEPSIEGGNWATLTYKQASAAQRAVRKNGEILGGVIMIGCRWVDEQHASDEARPAVTRSNSMIISRPLKTFEATDAFATPSQSTDKGFLGLISNAGKPNPAIFQNHGPEPGQPAAPNSYVNRALDLIFGW